MKISTYIDQESWMNDRLGKVTGTRLKDIVAGPITKEQVVKELESNKIIFKKTDKKEDLERLLSVDQIKKLKADKDKKIGFYELIAEALSISEEDCDGYIPNETPMNRGTRMQTYAIDQFSKRTGKIVDETLQMWMREDELRIAISPDGVISPKEAVETKCKSSAHHVKAYLTKKIPDEYDEQVRQYFIVNDELETLYFVFYDPRMPAIQYFVIEVHREDLGSEITILLQYQKDVFAEVDEIVKNITF